MATLCGDCGVGEDGRVSRVSVSRVLVVIGLVWVSACSAPNTRAAPNISDIDSLTDDSGPLPKDVAALTAIPELLFTTPSGLLCKKTVVKVMHSVTCAGDLPGAPPGTRVVNLAAVYDQAEGPADFLPTPPEHFFGDTTGQKPVPLPAGHKIVFWNFSGTRSLVCGVPPAAALVCVLKADGVIGPGPSAGPIVHGFVISAPQSQVF
jgi:hypothetical protein